MSNSASSTSQSVIRDLMQAQQMLLLIMDNIPQAVFWKDSDLVYLGCNQAFAEDAGFDSPQDVVGKTDYDMPWSEQAELYRADDQLVMDSGEPKLSYEEPQTTPDGGLIWLRTSKVPLADADGNPRGVLGMYEDVTERKQSELELGRLARAVEGTRDVVVITDMDGNIQFVNQAFVGITGYSREEALGQNPRILKSGKQSTEFYAEMWRTIGAGEVWQGEVTNRRKDGTEYEAQLTISPVRNAEGHVEELVAIQRDVTAQRQAEKALAASEARLALAIEAADAGIWELRVDSGEAYFSPRWFSMLGYEPEDLSHTYETWASLLHPDEAAAVQQAVQRHIQAGEDFGMDFRMRTRDEGWRWVHAIGKAVEKTPDGATLRLIGTHTDITDRVEAQLERERMYERRAEQVRAASAIAQELAAVPALEELFRRVVTLIKERFGYYHVQIFRHQPALDRVVLVAGYGEIGARMLAEGHSLPMGRGVVGTAAAAHRVVLASDVRESAEWTPNQFLPETRGELAVPIVLRDQLLGIVDVQSNVAGSLGEDDQLLLESICGPIAVAVEDTNLRQEMEARLRELNTLQRIMTRQEWDAFRTHDDIVDGFVFDQQSVVPASLSANAPASTSHEAISVPMDVSGEVIGILGVYEDPDRPLLGEEREILRDISGQVTEALQRAQLLEQAQSRAGRERLIRDIADKIQRATDLQSLMRITSEELRRALKGTRAYVRMGTEEELTQDTETGESGSGGSGSGGSGVGRANDWLRR